HNAGLLEFTAISNPAASRAYATDYGLLTTDFFRSYNRIMHLLNDKVALITGGSSGIGRATALRLASHGARVVVAARNQTALEEVVAGIKNRGGQALAAPRDVTKPEDCRLSFETRVNKVCRLDVLLGLVS